jgi:hypothetical protein
VTTKIFFQLVAKNGSDRHYRYEKFSWRLWRQDSSARLLSQVAVHDAIKGGGIRQGAEQPIRARVFAGAAGQGIANASQLIRELRNDL